MKTDWCWACKKEHAMLDEQEFAAVWQAYEETEKSRYGHIKSPQTVAEKRAILQNLSAQASPEPQNGLTTRQIRFRPLQDAYERITGLKFEGDDPKMIMHYRISFYGPPCPYCGRLLRNAQAKQCFVCSMDWHHPANVVRHGDS